MAVLALVCLEICRRTFFREVNSDHYRGMYSRKRLDGCPRGLDAFPWILSRHDDLNCLPWRGVTNFFDIVKLRSKPKGRWRKAVSVIFYSKGLEELLQNAVYTMVEFGGVDNYFVGTWSDDDLVACTALNLPCADVSSFLQRPLFQFNATALSDMGVKLAKKQDQATIIWARQSVVLKLLQMGYAVHQSDLDISYVPKNVWISFLKYIENAEADASFHWNYLGW